MRGVFITFEGIDGCGKSTQAELLVRALEERGMRTVHTREPGGTELGREIRELFLHLQGVDVDPSTEVLLMAADRADHVDRVIMPALTRGEVVISERYTDSTEAYQGYGGDAPLEAIRSINAFATRGLEPEITFLLDLEPSLAAERRAGRNDRVEAKSEAFHDRVRNGYLEIQRVYSHRIVRIDASASVQAIHEEILRHLQERGIL